MNSQEFPLDAYPNALSDFCEELAGSLNMSVSMAACAVLPVLATAIGSSRKVCIKEGHTEPSNIWLLVVSKSGSGKTPVLEKAIEPLKSFEKDMYTKFLEELKAYEDAIAEGDKTACKPVQKSLIVSDATVEAIADVLHKNQDGIILYRDEAAGLVGSLGRYNGSRGSDEAFFLELFNGGLIKVSRKGLDRDIYIPSPNASIVGGIQPSVFKDVFSDKDWTSGFVARFLIYYETGDATGYTVNTISAVTELGYRELVSKLYELRNKPKSEVKYNKKSLQLLIDWSNNELTPKINKADEGLASSLAKMVKYVARLSLILHCCKAPSNSVVKSDTVQAAIKIVNWFITGIGSMHKQSLSHVNKNVESEIVRHLRDNNGFITPRELSQRSRLFDSTAHARRSTYKLSCKGMVKISRKDGQFGFKLIR